MTVDAESGQTIFQEMVGFVRGMRIVAVDTSFLHRIMFKSYFGDGIADILMAVKTEFISRLEKVELIIGGVGIVAFYTMTLYHNFMTAFWILRHNGFMALVTNPARIFIQQLPMGGGMRVMTF